MSDEHRAPADAARALIAGWGRYLAGVRKGTGESQVDVACRAGIDQAQVSRAEAGNGVGLGVVLAMADALDVSVPELARGAEAMTAAAEERVA